MAGRTDPLPARIEKVLREHLQTDTIIDVSPSGVRDNLHVLVVSRALDNLTEKQKQEHLWGLLEDAVRDRVLRKADLNRISLVLPVSIEELRR